ncbi:DUF1684 domain-containing protein [Rhodonellum sp.]|uniref:DUF1684 domain-containing protein n=1 Tax=Rhodonellum sp. TaxID=2231180 RepID=UPI002722D315|nr:DUF1684 domain-containing protein [Rhodonellum sp.]MDO9551019.1 DUF1684 domain-containing protein [Rhodonellum sp.]
MKSQNIFLIIVVFVVSVSVVYMLTNSETTEDYIEKIEKERERQFKFIRFNIDSPLTAEQKQGFQALSFYPIDPEFRIKAKMVPVEDRKMIEVPLTDGSVEKYLRHSYAEFELKGKSHRLLLLQSVKEVDMRNFFLAFADATSGEETYGGGRYINLRQDGKNSITIDFNLAYNPYCAYNPDFACPLPPKENILEVGILAGEKDYKKE